jgi:hypothetical protein
MNDFGAVAGYFIDAAGMEHGFIRLPCWIGCSHDHDNILDNAKRVAMAGSKGQLQVKGSLPPM